jgi:hypothetical protein
LLQPAGSHRSSAAGNSLIKSNCWTSPSRSYLLQRGASLTSFRRRCFDRFKASAITGFGSAMISEPRGSFTGLMTSRGRTLRQPQVTAMSSLQIEGFCGQRTGTVIFLFSVRQREILPLSTRPTNLKVSSVHHLPRSIGASSLSRTDATLILKWWPETDFEV